MGEIEGWVRCLGKENENNCVICTTEGNGVCSSGGTSLGGGKEFSAFSRWDADLEGGAAKTGGWESDPIAGRSPADDVDRGI